MIKTEGRDIKYGWLLDCAWGYTLIVGFAFAVFYAVAITVMVRATDTQDMIFHGVLFVMIMCAFVGALSVAQFAGKIRDLLRA